MKTYTIKLDETTVTIETGSNKANSIDAILKAIFYDFYKNKPSKLSELLRVFSAYEEIAAEKLAARRERKSGMPLSESGAGVDTFDFWKRMIENPPNDTQSANK